MKPITKPCPNHPKRQAQPCGVCTACYATLYARVRRGAATWEQLEAQGLIKRKKQGRPVKLMKFI